MCFLNHENPREKYQVRHISHECDRKYFQSILGYLDSNIGSSVRNMYDQAGQCVINSGDRTSGSSEGDPRQPVIIEINRVMKTTPPPG